MSFKTELHAHTREVSPCADLSAEEVADRYIEAGYTSIVITNHYIQFIFDGVEGTWNDKVDYYLAPYRKMKEYAKGKLNVLLGCELRFNDNPNDYLILGLTEQFLYDHPELYKMTAKTFSEFSKKHGLLFVQAHPFRNGMKITPPHLLDGIEVFNGHQGHDSRNAMALAWAKLHGLLFTSGSDFHHPHSLTDAGIFTEAPITSMEQLMETLRSGNYTLHCSGPVAERDGMSDRLPSKP